MLAVAFDVGERQAVLSEEEATVVAEKLRAYAAGVYSTEVDELARLGTDRDWLAGARAMADAIEDVLTGTRNAPIPLDRHGRAAIAFLQVLRLTPITQPGARGSSPQRPDRRRLRRGLSSAHNEGRDLEWFATRGTHDPCGRRLRDTWGARKSLTYERHRDHLL